MTKIKSTISYKFFKGNKSSTLGNEISDTPKAKSTRSRRNRKNRRRWWQWRRITTSNKLPLLFHYIYLFIYPLLLTTKFIFLIPYSLKGVYTLIIVNHPQKQKKKENTEKLVFAELGSDIVIVGPTNVVTPNPSYYVSLWVRLLHCTQGRDHSISHQLKGNV